MLLKPDVGLYFISATQALTTKHLCFSVYPSVTTDSWQTMYLWAVKMFPLKSSTTNENNAGVIPMRKPHPPPLKERFWLELNEDEQSLLSITFWAEHSQSFLAVKTVDKWCFNPPLLFRDSFYSSTQCKQPALHLSQTICPISLICVCAGLKAVFVHTLVCTAESCPVRVWSALCHAIV